MDTPEILDTPAAAKRLGLAAKTLADWRLKGIGPAWIRVGGRQVRYRADAIEAYLNAETHPGAPHSAARPVRTLLGAAA